MNYKITFLDYWHTSSGLSAGAKLDSMVLKDENKLPYISGKTIKGLIKVNSQNNKFLKDCFGEGGNLQGNCYFSNVMIGKQTQEKIIKDELQNELFSIITSTKIDNNGISEDSSLRDIEVVVPISLYGCIENLDQKYKDEMSKALKSIKRLGLNRNRGLGRCKIEILGDKK